MHVYINTSFEDSPINEIVSLTVIGSNVYEADRFATAAFAIGKDGINFIEQLKSKLSISRYRFNPNIY